MGDRRAAASICSRHAHPGHPRQLMVKHRSPEAPSCSKVDGARVRHWVISESAVYKQRKEHRSFQSIRSLDEEVR